jgi:hypothetical protein
MVKHTTPSRRNGNGKPITGNPKTTAKLSPTRPNKHHLKQPSTSPSKVTRAADGQISTISPASKKQHKASTMPPNNKYQFGTQTNQENQTVLLAPLSVSLTELFINIHKSFKEVIQAFEFIDHSFGNQAEATDKEINIHLQICLTMMTLNKAAESEHWFNLFELLYTSLDPEFTDPGKGNDIRDFVLNLAANDPLVLFDSTKFDGEGNLFPSKLVHAWLGATALHGSIHLFFDVQLQKNRLAAQTFEDMHEDDKAYAVPMTGEPLAPWIDMQEREKQNSKAFEYSHRFREQVNKCCIEELCIIFGKFIQVQPQDMMIAVWITAFTDSITPRSSIFPMSIGREIRASGSDLTLSSPVKLFKAHGLSLAGNALMS